MAGKTNPFNRFSIRSDAEMRQSCGYHSLGDEAENAIQEGEDSDIGSR